MVGFVTTVGCSSSDRSNKREVYAARLGLTENDVEGMPPFPEDAVEGYFQKVVSGKVVGINTLTRPASAPNDLDAYMASGQPDDNGYVYYDVNGAQSLDGVVEYRFNYVGRTLHQTAEPAPDRILQTLPTPSPAAVPTVAPDLQAAIAQDPDAEVDLQIRVQGTLTSKLGVRPKIGLDALDPPDEVGRRAARTAKIQARKDEAAALEAPVISQIQDLGGTRIHGFFTSPSVMATLKASSIGEIAQRSDVVRIELSKRGAVDEGTWSGTEMKSTGGLNGHVYSDNGYDGTKYSTVGGSVLRIAPSGTGYIRADHKGFHYGSGSSSRLDKYDCSYCTPPPYNYC